MCCGFYATHISTGETGSWIRSVYFVVAQGIFSWTCCVLDEIVVDVCLGGVLFEYGGHALQ